MTNHPNASVVKMDTVYNDVSTGTYVQTFQFVKYHFMKGIYHTTINPEEMYKGLHSVYLALGEEEFRKIFEVILTDRGIEFVCAQAMEDLGCHVFYCDLWHQVKSLT